MNAEDLSELLEKAGNGEPASFARLYAAVYRPLYRIAAMATKSEEAATEAVKLTALDSYAALPTAGIKSGPAFVEWIIKILCTKLRHICKDSRLADKTDESSSYIKQALNSLPDIERLVFAVSTVCGCTAEKAASLCGYTEETVGVCLTNAEVSLKAALLSKEPI